MNDAKWVRPVFLSLVGLFGLVLLTTGLIRGAMAGFHIAEPRYGVADSRVDRVADAITLQSQILVQSLALAGNAPPGFDQVVRDEQDRMRRRAIQAVKDEAYDDAVLGALQFVLGGFLFMAGSGSAKRAARRLASAPAVAQGPSGGAAFTPPSASRGPTISAESPVGRLQEAPARAPDPRAVQPTRATEPRATPVAPRMPEPRPAPVVPKTAEPKGAPEETKRGTRKAAAPKRPAAAPAPRPAAAPPRPAAVPPRPATPVSPNPAPAPRPATAPDGPKAEPEAGPASTRPSPPASPAAPATERPAAPGTGTPPLASPPRPRPAAPTPASPPAPPFRPAPPPEPGKEKTEP